MGFGKHPFRFHLWCRLQVGLTKHSMAFWIFPSDICISMQCIWSLTLGQSYQESMIHKTGSVCMMWQDGCRPGQAAWEV